MIRAVVFDFGGPVLRTPWELGVPGGPFGDDPEWRAVVDGTLSERQYWRRRADGDIPAFMRAVYQGQDAIRPEAEQCLADVTRAGLRTAILTNDLAAFQTPEWVRGNTFVQTVDVLADASVTGLAKPDPRAYREVLAALRVEAREAVFLDDLPRNVRGARAVGMTAIWFDVGDVAGSYARLADAVHVPV
ncbi:MAG: HAD-IA family hydrolase [Jatrophihabitans sp.]|uniref:HAD-IA family hydrolase n=1 Tax=Jatrophihabitans sp. TaxID=1932789 RepID=UPI003F7DA04E